MLYSAAACAFRSSLRIVVKKDRWILTIRSWLGIIACLVAVVAAAWLLSVYIHDLNVYPDNAAQVKTLRKNAQDDKAAYDILLSELEKLNRAEARRGRIYKTGGLVLILSFGVFLAWIRWLHPGPGEWAGIPEGCTKHADRWIGATRSWLGIVAGILAIAAAVWIFSVYIHARVVDPANAARVEALKEEAKTDTKVQEILQPDLEKQYLSLYKRRSAYDLGGSVLLVSIGIFLVWIRWIRPGPGEWIGLPSRIARRMPAGVDTEIRETPAVLRALTESGVRPAASPPPPPADISEKAFDVPETVDLAPVDSILQREGNRPESVIPILQSIQSHYRYLPDAALRYICEKGGISPSQISGVSTFYTQFRHKPVGKHIIRVCEGTACHVSGAVEVGNELRRCLNIKGDSDTDPSGQFTIERVACIGSCSLAPVITIDENIYGHMSALSAGETLQDFVRTTKSSGPNGNGKHGKSHKGLQSKGSTRLPVEIRIGMGSCGVASGAREIHAALEHQVELLGGGAEIKSVGCRGICHHEPLIEIVDNGRSTLYGNVRPSDVRKIVRKHVRPQSFLRRIHEGFRDTHARLFDDRAWKPAKESRVDATPYTGKQVHVVLENCGIINPLSLEDYRSHDGIQALEECLKKLSPEEVIDKIRASGLRGRGGAGFPAAVKWDLTRRAPGTAKYVICNGDEGDPGAFMDRAVLEADPFRVIEGLAIAAYAVGASEGFIYVRREYPIAARHLRQAIQTATVDGLLGKNILGTSFNFKLHIREGAGAFVCGEETALIQSLEGKRGMPRPKPPYPAQSGLWGKPTLINNVETLACIPWILRKGPEEFASLGTEKSKGTKVFALAGKIKRGGLIEVPMGISIREIVEDIGGGIKDGRTFKAVLTGGPSGGCIPARLADTRIDYEELTAMGAIMGSGGLVVLDDRDCMVDIARYFLRFTQDESCGKCTFCRIGTKRMLEILDRICEGNGKEGDIETLEELSHQVKKASLCGLGQTAPNPVLTTIRFFREEYEAHIQDRRCPAAHCKALIRFRILDNCTGCTLCAQACPAGAIEARPYKRHEVDDNLCTRCGMCVTACPENAVEAE
jgi:NADH-quinone oxidoreductase subunit F